MRNEGIRPDYMAHLKYSGAYSRFIRRFGDYLQKAFEENSEMTIEELAEKLANITRDDSAVGRPIRMQPEVLRKYMKRHQKLKSYPIVEEIRYHWEKPSETQTEDPKS